MPRFEKCLHASVDFYVAALMRNQPLLENTLRLMPQNEAMGKSTVMVVGGFHTDYLNRELTRKGIPMSFTRLKSIIKPRGRGALCRTIPGRTANAQQRWNGSQPTEASEVSPRWYEGAGLVIE